MTGRGSIGTGPRIDWYRAADRLVPGREITKYILVVAPLVSGHVIGRFFSCKHYCMHRVRAQKHKVSIVDGAGL